MRDGGRAPSPRPESLTRHATRSERSERRRTSLGLPRASTRPSPSAAPIAVCPITRDSWDCTPPPPEGLQRPLRIGHPPPETQSPPPLPRMSQHSAPRVGESRPPPPLPLGTRLSSTVRGTGTTKCAAPPRMGVVPMAAFCSIALVACLISPPEFVCRSLSRATAVQAPPHHLTLAAPDNPSAPNSCNAATTAVARPCIHQLAPHWMGRL